MAQGLQSRHAGASPEKIALLYLGDETMEGTLRIRGIVRNITADPIEKLDAAIRFFARDGNLLETILVRMDKETIAPDEIARLELVVPNHTMEYAGYALEFKLRQGETVAYKDMRETRIPNNDDRSINNLYHRHSRRHFNIGPTMKNRFRKNYRITQFYFVISSHDKFQISTPISDSLPGQISFPDSAGIPDGHPDSHRQHVFALGIEICRGWPQADLE